MKYRHAMMAGVGLGLVLLGASASAQTSLVKEKTAAAQTNVVTEGSQQALAADAFAASDETSLKLAAGASILAGNANSVGLTGSGSLRLRRSLNQYSADAAVNWGQAAVPDASGISTWDQMTQNAENYQGRIRYDRFLSRRWTLFAMLQGRRDRFQAYDLRLNFDPGLAFYVIQKENHHFRIEAGYDLSYDVRERTGLAALNGALVRGDAGYLPPESIRHGMRFDLAYDIAFNDKVGFATELELLAPFEFDPTFPFRLNWTNGLTANLSSRFAFVAGFTLRYDNAPVGRQNTDAMASLNLSYTLL
jgi:putative salt-induced outer membrane protein YdiY